MLVGQLEKTACDIYGTSANRQRGRYHDSTYGKDNDEVHSKGRGMVPTPLSVGRSSVNVTCSLLKLPHQHLFSFLWT